MKKVLILGAGIAGLSCALELTKLNIPVELVELESDIGGLARNFHHQGFTFDIGPHRIFSEFPDIIKLIREMGGEEIQQVHRQSRMRMKGKYFHYPFQTGELFKKLPPSLILQFGMGFLGTQLSSHQPSPEDDNYAGYLSKRFGKALCRFFFFPYAKKVWGITPESISSDIIKVRLAQENMWDTLRKILKPETQGPNQSYVSDFYYPRQGIGMIARKMGEQLEKAGVIIHRGVKITGFIMDKTLYGSFIKQVQGIKQSTKVTFTADSIISTIPLAELVQMVQPEYEEIITAASALKHRHLILCCFMLRQNTISNDHWLYYPEEEYHFTRLHQPKNFSPSLCPPNKSSIVAELTCFENDSYWRSTDMELFDMLSDDLLATDLVRVTDIEDYQIYRIKHAYPVYNLDYKNNLTRIFNFLRSFSNLITTGRQGLFHHNNLDHSILMGQAAARHVRDNPDTLSGWYDGIETFNQFRIID